MVYSSHCIAVGNQDYNTVGAKNICIYITLKSNSIIIIELVGFFHTTNLNMLE